MTAIDRTLTTLNVRHADGSAAETQLSAAEPTMFDASIPWRRFRSYRGMRHYSGNYWAATTEGPVEYESRLELANLIELDFTSDASWIRAQPFRMSGKDGTRMRHHIPDYLVECADGSLRVVDVKPARLLEEPKVKAVLTWSRRVVEAAAWEYVVLAEPDARRHANIRFLSGYRRPSQFPAAETEAVAEVLDQPTTVRIATSRAADVLGDQDLARGTVLHLIWTGRLQVDLSEVLQGHSIVSRAS